MLWHVVLCAAATLALMWMRPLTARAEEACPATLVAFRAHDALAVQTFRLTAKKKMQPADVAVDTDRGWFRVALPHEGVWDVRFTRPVSIRNAFVENTGGARCDPPLPEDRLDLSDAPPPPAREHQVAQAQIREPYGRSDCPAPFQSVRALNVVEPDFRPANAVFAGTAIIEVLVMPDGKTAGEKIVQSSGTPGFDDAALEAARKTTYTPAIAYCAAAIGRYSYKAHIRP